MIIMSADLGLSRTGIAVCDKSEILAVPLTVIHEKNQNKLIDSIYKEFQNAKAELLVLGLPKNMNGSDGEGVHRTRQIANSLKQSYNMDIVTWDERRTTVTATQYLNQTNTRGKKRKAVIDSVSAVIILQNYLDFRHNTNKYPSA